MSGVVAAAVKSGEAGGEQGVEIVVDVDRDAVEAELGRALERRALGDDRARLRAAKAHAERVAAERRAQRHRDRAELVDRDVGDHGLGPLREDQRDPVARRDALRGERVREPVRRLASARRR